MRGRYTLHCRAEEIAERFGVHVLPTLPERFNIPSPNRSWLSGSTQKYTSENLRAFAGG
jgi:hypothetical protein